MADDKSKRDFRDRAHVSAEEDYEVRSFASKAGISEDQARELIKKHGNDRRALAEAATALRSR